MRKITAIILVLALLAALCACGEMNTINIDPAVSPNTITNMVPDPDPLPTDEALISGDWYTQQYGLIICLSLDAEGKYTIIRPSIDKKTAEGTWTLENELIYLDGAGKADFNVQGDQLDWIETGLVFTRDMPQVYAPGSAVSAKSGDLDGYWKSVYVKTGEAYVSADMLDDNTDIYIEGANVAMGGAMLLDTLAVFEFEDGALCLKLGENKDASAVKIELLDDGMMRLTVGSDDSAVIILEKRPQP